ncbi:MAG: hypothetical protein ABH869_04865 [Candidatus Omnitrophota bacterium]
MSLDGLIGDIAWQVIKEGHDAKYYIKDEDNQDIADGFVPKTEDWQKETDWADVIIFDDVLGHGKSAQELRKQSKAVIGGMEYTDQLEDDRAFGQEELKKAGINILKYGEFTFFNDAIEYVCRIYRYKLYCKFFGYISVRVYCSVWLSCYIYSAGGYSDAGKRFFVRYCERNFNGI